METEKITKWLVSKVPFAESLDPEELDMLCNLYISYENSKIIRDNTFEMAMRHNQAGIDYSTDYGKANETVVEREELLDNYLTALKNKYAQEEEFHKKF